MEDVLASPITWIIVAAASELIALSPLRDNSVIQVLLRLAMKLKNHKA
jgi:hypothetical protein